jgi:hypothetical protein
VAVGGLGIGVGEAKNYLTKKKEKEKEDSSLKAELRKIRGIRRSILRGEVKKNEARAGSFPSRN